MTHLLGLELEIHLIDDSQGGDHHYYLPFVYEWPPPVFIYVLCFTMSTLQGFSIICSLSLLFIYFLYFSFKGVLLQRPIKNWHRFLFVVVDKEGQTRCTGHMGRAI